MNITMFIFGAITGLFLTVYFGALYAMVIAIVLFLIYISVGIIKIIKE
jgi:uncharacterized membrane protein YoaK (UPF0700 family)